jgi:hypothetical protein
VVCRDGHSSGVATGNDVAAGRSYLRFAKHADHQGRQQISRRRLQMFTRKIQIGAALLAVIALAAIAAFTSVASAALNRPCPPNPYTVAGRSCIAQQASVQSTRRRVVAKRSPHKVVKKHSSKQCQTSNPYARYIYCR